MVDTSKAPLSSERLCQVGLPENAQIYSHIECKSKGLRRSIEDICGGVPDIVIGWWGSAILGELESYHRAFPEVACLLIIDTLPNAAHLLSEARETLNYNRSTWVDGFISYSDKMTSLLRARVPHSRNKPFFSLIEPFPQISYSNGGDVGIRLEKDHRPALIFTGRADLLFKQETKFRKDAVGEHLISIVRQGARVFVHEKSGIDSTTGLETYPEFSNADLMNGVFANFISQFDGHLTIYNESNGTIRRRVRTGLSTRLALAMTADAPVVASSESAFLLPLWGERPFGFTYRTPQDLVAQLSNREKMAVLRENMRQRKQEFSMEQQQLNIQNFLCGFT